ncbi:hypothetical protein [Sphingomonas crocodyli]|uniref:DUF2383 domain-containing protein n=1 Tax=Sphingomonas crocodyli TaxID=1979270 RepID=A0A437LYN9_9SPHN|nr:hypothetical protein [Sphingomonas crocodyli]RVT90502.1 hypothetical protein EOD43_19835 [Sphingomonas crocodyli]
MPPPINDHDALRAIGSRLTDVSKLYENAAQIADKADLREHLFERARQRREMSNAFSAFLDGEELDGSALSIFDKLRLTVDRVIEGDDRAACENVERADADLASMIEDQLADPELEATAGDVLRDLRARLPRDLPHVPGLRDIAREDEQKI